jgi:hypothetical protein
MVLVIGATGTVGVGADERLPLRVARFHRQAERQMDTAAFQAPRAR